MHDMLLPKAMCSESRDLFIFWKKVRVGTVSSELLGFVFIFSFFVTGPRVR